MRRKQIGGNRRIQRGWRQHTSTTCRRRRSRSWPSHPANSAARRGPTRCRFHHVCPPTRPPTLELKGLSKTNPPHPPRQYSLGAGTRRVPAATLNSASLPARGQWRHALLHCPSQRGDGALFICLPPEPDAPIFARYRARSSERCRYPRQAPTSSERDA